MSESAPKKFKIFTVRKFSERNEAFSEASLRWMIHNQHANGMAEAGVILRVGRRVLIDEDRFFDWLHKCNDRRSA